MSTTTSANPAPSIALRRLRAPRIIPPRADRNWAWIIIPVLMVLSGILRFASIERTPIWGDEAAVAWRTCGSYREMVDILRNDGFVPLHYTFFWLIRQVHPLTPFVLRFVPTVASILMIPAMYFLARQLVSRRTALVVAAFTAFSAHLGWHAQDAKMYMHFWLMCTLCMGSSLWWLRHGGGLPFWCWVASGVCMVGLHSVGWFIIALQPLFMLFRGKAAGRSWWWVLRGFAAFILGLCIIGVGPVYYYLAFNQWTQNIQDRGWDASGIAWIRMFFTPNISELVPQAVIHFLFGYDFPPPASNGVTAPNAWVLWGIIPGVISVLVALSMFPYPTRRRGREVSLLPIAWWRTALYLSAWVLLPPYAFYCASIEGYAWPHEAIGALLTVIAQSTAGVVAVCTVSFLAFYFCATTWRGRTQKLFALIVIAVTIMLVATAIALALRHRPPGPLWVSRYMSFVWPGFIISLFALLGRLPMPPIRWIVVAALIGGNIYACVARDIWRQDPPVDLLAKDFIASQAQNSTTRAYAIGMSPREKLSDLPGRYYLFLYSGRPTHPWEFAGGSVSYIFHLPEGTITDGIYKDFTGTSGIQRIIVWQQVGMSGGTRTVPPIPRDKLLARLPAGWKCVSEDLYPFAARWGWGELKGCWSRREFVAPAAAN